LLPALLITKLLMLNQKPDCLASFKLSSELTTFLPGKFHVIKDFLIFFASLTSYSIDYPKVIL